MEHPEDPATITVGEGGVGHIQPWDLRRERQHIPRVDLAGDIGNVLGGYHPSRMPVQPMLHPSDLPEDAVICKSGVAAAVLGHEAERARILDPAQLRATVTQESP